MDWFRHDLAAHDDRKVRIILKKGGLAALGAFWWITEMLYASEGYLTDEEVSQELEIMDGLELKDMLLEAGLFTIDENGIWSNSRILEEIQFEAERKEHFRTIGRAGGQRTSSTRLANGKHTLSVGQAPIPMTNDHKDCNFSSPLQEEKESINKKSLCSKPEIATSELQNSGAIGGASDAVFITIQSNQGEEVPVRESFVKTLEEAYPAVDVRDQLRQMKAWCISNPKNRKTKSGIPRFINTWLSKNQNRSGRIPQHSYDTIRGTNIQMSLVADGTRPDYEEPEVKFQ